MLDTDDDDDDEEDEAVAPAVHLPSPLSACRRPLPQKGEFNSQCGDRCENDIVLKSFPPVDVAAVALLRRRYRCQSPLPPPL